VLDQLFRKLDGDGDGLVGLDDLLKLFREKKDEEEQEEEASAATDNNVSSFETVRLKHNA